MSNSKQLRARLKSIQNTRKITKAMEMIAASKMKRVISHALVTREYSQTAWEILIRITESVKTHHPLLSLRDSRKICLILITPNKGLCGGLISQLTKKVLFNIKNPYNMMINRIGGKKMLPRIDPSEAKIDIIAVGKKGRDEMIKADQNVIASFTNLNEQTSPQDINPIIKIVIDSYTKKKYDKIIIAYSDFISTVLNKPRLRQILPISREDLEKQLEELGGGISKEEEMEEVKQEVGRRYYTFEPNRKKILNIILPKIVAVQIYQAFLESQAAEFSTRMITMKNASETASDMIYNFNLQYNQTRQAAITSELAEISGGMIALEE
jgi:F-type H+-transporting ATPase subunit gamma